MSRSTCQVQQTSNSQKPAQPCHSIKQTHSLCTTHLYLVTIPRLLPQNTGYMSAHLCHPLIHQEGGKLLADGEIHFSLQPGIHSGDQGPRKIHAKSICALILPLVKFGSQKLNDRMCSAGEPCLTALRHSLWVNLCNSLFSRSDSLEKPILRLAKT